MLVFCYYHSVLLLEIWDGGTSISSFLIQDYFGHPRFLFFHIHLKVTLLNFYEESGWNFNEDYFEFIDSFGRKAILKIVILRIHKRDLMSFFTGFLTRSFIILVEVIPGYNGGYCKRHHFPDFFLKCLPFVCRKTTDMLCNNFVT